MSSGWAIADLSCWQGSGGEDAYPRTAPGAALLHLQNAILRRGAAFDREASALFGNGDCLVQGRTAFWLVRLCVGVVVRVEDGAIPQDLSKFHALHVCAATDEDLGGLAV